MGDDITIGVTEIVNNIEVTAQPNDQIVDISVIDNADDVTLNITPTVIEINVNKGSSYAKWGTISGTLSDQTDLQDALDLKADLVDGKVPSSQLPSYVDDVIEVANYTALPATGETGKIYLTLDTNHIYRWTGSTYVEITDNTAVWGAITGTLSSQTDLQSALNLKVPYYGATSDVFLGAYGLVTNSVSFNTSPLTTPTSLGSMYWDSANRTVSLIDGDGDTTLQIGQEQKILVHNNTGSTLTDGQVVYVTGSTGNLPSVALASAIIESTSAATIGVVTESIAHGADGFITTSGIVNGLNTNAFNEGDLLWLGTTAGTFSTTKPISPNHLVLIGYVIKKAGGNGSILVKIQNTQELDECSDVLFSGLANNDLLVYETASALWKNKSLATVLGYTPVSPTRTISTTSPLQGGGDLSANRTLSITQASSSTNGYLSSTDWNTFNGKQNALTNPITGIGTTNYISKFSGTSALSNSIIYDSGASIGIGTSSPLSALHISKNASELLRIQRSTVSDYSFNLGASNDLSIINNNSALTVLSINSSGNSTFVGSVTASSIIKSGGTSAQFLKADGSVDTNTYQLYNPYTVVAGTYTANYVPKFTGSGTIIGNSLISDDGSNIAIGTTSPLTAGGASKWFTLNGNVGTYSGGHIYAIGGAAKFYHYVDNDGLFAHQSQTGIGQKFFANGSEAMRITSTGNVGIGTTSPTSKLHVVGLPEYTTNVAAISGGLTAGAFYHTAGVLKVVI